MFFLLRYCIIDRITPSAIIIVVDSKTLAFIFVMLLEVKLL